MIDAAAARVGLARSIEATGRYYTERLERHGPTPLGVDWSCVPTQELRFVQLLKLRGTRRKFSLNDLGCGYGALLAYLDRRHPRATIDYLGVDISAAMIVQANKLWPHRQGARFEVGHACSREADFSLASGIFNVRMDVRPDDWTDFIAITLDGMQASSRQGFAVNFLEPAPAGPPPAPELYRAPQQLWARYCEQRFGSNVEVVSGYGMREYTLLVRRPSGNV